MKRLWPDKFAFLHGLNSVTLSKLVGMDGFFVVNIKLVLDVRGDVGIKSIR